MTDGQKVDAADFIAGLDRARQAIIRQSILIAAIRWQRARADVIDASIYPIGNEEYRVRLNGLSEAEDALSRAVGEL